MKLSEQLKLAQRLAKDEWIMDLFIRLAIELETEKEKVAELEKKLSDAWAAYNRDVEDICP